MKSESHRTGLVLVVFMTNFVWVVSGVVSNIPQVSLVQSTLVNEFQKPPLRLARANTKTPTQNQVPTQQYQPSRRPVGKQPTLAPSDLSAADRWPLPRITVGFYLERFSSLDEPSFSRVLTTFMRDLLQQFCFRGTRDKPQQQPQNPCDVKLECQLVYEPQDGEGQAVVSGNWTGPLNDAPTEADIKLAIGPVGLKSLMKTFNESGLPPVRAIWVRVNEDNVLPTENTTIGFNNSASNSNNTAIVAALLLFLVAFVVGVTVLTIIFVMRLRAVWRNKLMALKSSNVASSKQLPDATPDDIRASSCTPSPSNGNNTATPTTVDNETNGQVHSKIQTSSVFLRDSSFHGSEDVDGHSSLVEEVSGVTSMFTTISLYSLGLSNDYEECDISRNIL